MPQRSGAAARLLVAVVSSVALTACATTAGAPEPPAAAARSETADWGIEILGIRRSAAGYMLDFRYRVLDAQKAVPIFDRKTRPLLVHEASGTELPVMSGSKTGPLRNSNFPREGRGYFIFFVNPGQLVQAGDAVTVVIGEFAARHLIVQ